MSDLRSMGGDVENALERVGVPSYVIDRHGIIRTAIEGAFGVNELTKAVKGVTG